MSDHKQTYCTDQGQRREPSPACRGGSHVRCFLSLWIERLWFRSLGQLKERIKCTPRLPYYSAKVSFHTGEERGACRTSQYTRSIRGTTDSAWNSTIRCLALFPMRLRRSGSSIKSCIALRNAQ